MNDKTGRPTRRAIIRGSTVGSIAAFMGSPAGSESGSDGSQAIKTQGQMAVLPDLSALAKFPQVGFGTRVILSEHLRRGEFVSRPRNEYQGQVVSDPYQAFCVPSSVNSEIVWVRDYIGPASLDWGGAQGDGIKDDEPFINSMLKNPYVSWFQVEDQRIHFVARSVLIRRPIKLSGAGVKASTFMVRSSIDAIDVSLSSGLDHGLDLADFGIINAQPTGTSTAGSGIKFDLTYLAKISNISVYNCYNGLSFARSGLSNIEAIHINSCQNAGIIVNGGENYYLRFSGFTISGGIFSIKLQEMCDELIFSDGVCSSSTYALYTDSTLNLVNKRPEFCRFTRVSFDSCSNGIDLANSADFVFDGCFISCRPNHGAQIGVRGPTENIQFVTSTFFNNAKSAAIVGSHAVDSDFQGCKFISNGTTECNKYDAIIFAQGCGSFSLTNSRFRQGWNVASTPRYQVHIEGGGGSGAYSLIGNQFSAGGTGTVLDERIGKERNILGNAGLS